MAIISTSGVDSHVLMQVPELYRYGREGSWFGIKSFFVYMFNGLYQVSIIMQRYCV